MRLEYPQLSLKISKTPIKSWLTRNITKRNIVLSLAPIVKGKKKELFTPFKDIHSWGHLSKNEVNLSSFPSNFYDVVYLYKVLEEYDYDNQRKLIKECLRVVKKGGLVIALSKACNDAEEVYKLVQPLGINVEKFIKERLTNKTIALLRPEEAIFLTNLMVVPDRRRLVGVLKQEFGFDVQLDQLWKAGPKFSTNRLYVGMKWQRK